MKKIKNNSESAKTWCGQEIQPDEYYTIQSSEMYTWANDSDLLSDIGTGTAIINDGEDDITDVNEAINFLKGTDPTPRDTDGSPLTRGKITQTGWSYQMHGVEFETSVVNSIYSKKDNGDDWGYGTIKLYKANGDLITDQGVADTDCVKTIMDWEPTFDYDVVGGFFKLVEKISDDVRLWVIGVPDVPAEYGGSKVFITNINLKFLGQEEGIKVDGRAAKSLLYSAQNHTNKLRIIMKHAAGYKLKASMIFEFFKA